MFLSTLHNTTPGDTKIALLKTIFFREPDSVNSINASLVFSIENN